MRFDIAYDGTDFHGWARQPDQRTVCGTLEEALATLLRVPVRLTVAGRTDAGVHATAQVAHVDVPRDLHLAGELLLLVRRLTRLLPVDVRVTAIRPVPGDFDARFSALRRHYEYRLGTATWGVPPMRARDTVHHPPRSGRALDVDAMNEASTRLLGLNDFAAYCRCRPGATTVRELQRFNWNRHGNHLLIAEVSADAFCWSMVRSLVGAMLMVGEGRHDIDWPHRLLGSSGRDQSITVAPAHGLCLTGVDYPLDSELAPRNQQTMAVRASANTPTAGDTPR